ncbi:anthranilate synthase component II [Rhodothalassium salexigens DSM 2132]|uniref:Anthranilate synthase component II n=1 Tax=Rhodothalassium salexigens DSM 2132 TaxID=1188247 RepID=A0A4R2PQZ4_RHOSA|nr:aminodeoxychorismate/anthranilate synthase component II [Rhodothalassium salexigens]MBB4209962.1 anthranilate synthase component 2 [Rhodothalassium salexigens DSM 2132]MBK1637666.1 aminodeoxychorismate/anthranilate synthase component II [Rhodothalassium salexigens DSM 2132]TCP38127.1 anthranilate synthase component II [Rhodothalassium salexigens DSM 2132]
MYILIDNYDSFTYNLYHYLRDLGVEVAVHRNDQITPDAVLAARPAGVVISPGPGTPDDAGITLALVAAAAEARLPLLGVCLGHQAIGQWAGATVVRAEAMHGKTSPVHHDGSGVFHGLANPFEAARYHSLVLDRATIPETLRITAETADGIVMGIEHRSLPLHGVQFHPESIASAHGHDLLANFLATTRPARAA